MNGDGWLMTAVCCMVCPACCILSGGYCLLFSVCCFLSWCFPSAIWCLVSGALCLISGVWGFQYYSLCNDLCLPRSRGHYFSHQKQFCLGGIIQISNFSYPKNLKCPQIFHKYKIFSKYVPILPRRVPQLIWNLRFPCKEVTSAWPPKLLHCATQTVILD